MGSRADAFHVPSFLLLRAEPRLRNAALSCAHRLSFTLCVLLCRRLGCPGFTGGLHSKPPQFWCPEPAPSPSAQPVGTRRAPGGAGPFQSHSACAAPLTAGPPEAGLLTGLRVWCSRGGGFAKGHPYWIRLFAVPNETGFSLFSELSHIHIAFCFSCVCLFVHVCACV